MKYIFPFALLFSSITSIAQPKTITQAIVTTKTTIMSAENEDAPSSGFQSENGEEVRVLRLGGDGETKSTTYLKNDRVKTVINNEMGRTTTIRDNTNKKTTTLMEIMGKKTGFSATDEEQEEMRKRMDSLMQSRRQEGNMDQSGRAIVNTKIEYEDESKKIAGCTCKKALVINTRKNGMVDTSIVWYNPDIKLQGLTSTGGSSGFGAFMRNNTIAELAKIDGFIMAYEMKLNRGRIIKVEVTKLETDKEIADKEFEIPKDFEIKPIKEMTNGGGGIQMRIGS